MLYVCVFIYVFHNKYTQYTQIYHVNKIVWQHYKLHIEILQIIIIFTKPVNLLYT